SAPGNAPVTSASPPVLTSGNTSDATERIFMARGPRANGLDVAPLCPAGHLPHEGGDQPAARVSPIGDVAEQVTRAKLPISPRVGEMSGRTEGGDIERGLYATDHSSRSIIFCV